MDRLELIEILNAAASDLERMAERLTTGDLNPIDVAEALADMGYFFSKLESDIEEEG